MLQHKVFALVLSCACCVALAPIGAKADDFAPPPWMRAHPRAITAEWEFFTPADPLAPDGPLTNVGTKGSGTIPTIADVFADGWGMGDGDGGWFFADPGSIVFDVDNVVDVEPVKHIWLQVTHTPGLPLGIDPLAGFNMSATGSAPGPVSMIPHGPTSTIFHWDMFPNPPWERFTLLVFGTGEIDQVVVDTISIPEPSTLVLSGLGLAGLGLIARRRHKQT
jgi:hypothetical protein